MNKTILIILSFVVVIFGAFVLWYFLSENNKPAQEITTSVKLPIAQQNPVSTSDSGPTQEQLLSLTAADGGTMNVLNFLNDTETIADPVNSGYYDFGYSATSTPPFMITYIAATQYFNIELLQEPIGRARKLAEQYLMQHLGISSVDLCRLKYTISAPTSVSSFYGGASLGFSFCPGATKLPE